VLFDGTGDYLTIASTGDFAFGTGDFTIEMFVYHTNLTGQQTYFGDTYGGGSGADGIYTYKTGDNEISLYDTAQRSLSAKNIIQLNTWHHIAWTRSSGTLRAFLDGVKVDEDTYTGDFTTTQYYVGDTAGTSSGEMFGYISNLRVLKGTALYTSDFTVPTHELEVIGDTVLLCCNNPDSAGADGTGKTITVNGDAAGSTFSPGLTRDFTSGTEFRGVTTFDTQGYFVPPSGTTEQRNLCGTRGLFGGSNPTPADGSGNAIEFITVSTTGNSQDFGDRIGKGRRQIAAMADRTRGVFGGSYGPSSTMGDTIDFVTIASTGNAVDFGDCLNDLTEATGISNNTRGIMAGGRTPTVHDVMQYVTIKSLGNAIDFGNLLVAKRNCGSFQSPTRGVVVGGRNSGGTSLKVIEYVEISTLGNSVDFGDLSTAGGEVNMGGSNSVRGIIGGGNPSTNAIEYVTISTTGNSQDFGDNTAAARGLNTMATSPTRACMYGAVAPARDLSYVEIATTGDAQDFGNLSIDPTSNYHAGTSNGHGGLS
jgi:hypothetical protein